MSIIYDALQKTQRHRSSLNRDNQFRDQYGVRWLDKIVILAMLVLCGFVLYAYRAHFLAFFQRSTSVKTVAAAVVPVKPAAPVLTAPADLILNGVLLSEQNQTALINNQFYHVGDIVNGMRIVSIELNNVKLQDENRLVTLRTGN